MSKLCFRIIVCIAVWKIVLFAQRYFDQWFFFFPEHYFGAVHSNDCGLGPMTNMGHGLELSENIKCPKKKKKRFGFNLLCLIIVTRHCITMATSTERRSSWKSHFSKPCHIESKCFYRESFFFQPFTSISMASLCRSHTSCVRCQIPS